MKNEFVTYNQALALKELGFDEPCLGHYDNPENPVWITDSPPYYANKENVCLAPLKQQAFRFLREKHGLYTEIFVDDNKTFGFMISYFIGKDYFDERVDKPIHRGFSTYEEAEQACLDKLIEICKNNSTSI
jgi:hypothetical protein